MSLESQLTQSTAVFVGRVEVVDGWQRRARLLVTEHIKGRFAAASTVDVHADNRTTCAAPAFEGAELLVFLDELANGDPAITFCSAFLARTLDLPHLRREPEPEVLEFLRTTVKEYLAQPHKKPEPPPTTR